MKTVVRVWLITVLLCGAAIAAGVDAGPFPTSPATTSTPYTFNFTPSGGAAPYTYTVTSGTLPRGLSITSGTVLSGTPSVPGSYPITFRVTDNDSTTATVSGSLVVNAGALAAYVTSATWQTASTGTQTSVLMPGTPGNHTQIPGNSVTLSSVVFSASSLYDCGGASSYPTCSTNTEPGWIHSPGSLVPIVATLPHSSNFTSVGVVVGAYYGNNPQTATVTATTVAGVSLTLTVTPGTSSTFVGFVSSAVNDPVASVSMRADSSSNEAVLFELDYYATAWPGLSISTRDPLTSGATGVPYNLVMVGAGGTGVAARYSWSATGLPAGLSMSTGGVITGTPTTAGISPSIQITLTDTFTGQTTGPQPYSMAILQSTTTSLNSSLTSPSIFGKPLTLTATVFPGSTTGVVTFFNGTTILGSKPLSSGTATLATSLLPSGSNKLKAFYTGNPISGSSKSSVVTQVVKSNLQNDFQTAVAYNTGVGSTHAISVVTGDFNADGLPDLAAVNYFSGSGTVGVLLGNSNGTFGTVANYTVGAGANAIATGDFNNDGKTDLAVTAGTANSVGILLGNGDGTFQIAANYPNGQGTSNPAGLVIADFDGDGNADVATVNNSSSNITIFLGNGAGALGIPGVVSAGATPTALAAGDFNGDGLTDLAMVDSTVGTVQVLLGSGGGGFGAAVSYGLGSGVTSAVRITTGDFNGDGNLDLVTANFSSDSVSILLGASNGTFGTATKVFLGASTGPFGITAGDFNGDGKLDIAVAAQTGSLLEVLTGDGSGGLTVFAAKFISGNPTGLAVADFNGDGVSDVVTANYAAETVSVLLGVPTVFGGQPVSLTWLFPDLSTTYGGPTTTTVGAGYEFTNFFTENTAFNVNFGDNTIQIDSAQTRPPANNFGLAGAAFNGLAVTIPGGSPIPNITNVSLINSNWPDGNGNPFTRSRITFDATHIYADFRGMVNLVGDSITLKVNQSLTASTTTLTSTPNPSTSGQIVTFTATVSAGATGTVSFYKDSVGAQNLLGNATISGTTALFVTSTLPAGTTNVVAFYNGDSAFDVSTSNTVAQGQVPAANVVLASSANPSTVGQSIDLTATITPSSATGTVTFRDFSELTLASIPVSGGVAVFTTSSLSVNTHSITAAYLGDGNNGSATSAALSQVVNINATTTVLETSPNPSVAGLEVALTATVTRNGSVTPPGGTVTFKEGQTPLGAPVSLDQNGVAVLQHTFPGYGNHVLTAEYSGDTNDQASTSTSFNQFVVAAAPTHITALNNPGFFGKPILFRIQGLSFSEITITDGADVLGTVYPDNDQYGEAFFETSVLTPGTHTITATRAASEPYPASSESVEQLILPQTTTTLSSAGGLLGQSVTLTATVSPSDVTGRVVFFDGATMLGSADVSEGGTATFHTPLIPSGYRLLRASYSGSASYSPSISAATPVTIQVRPQAGLNVSSLTTYPTGRWTIASVLGDFNVDGKQDLAVLDIDNLQQFNAGIVTVLIGKGDGTFQDLEHGSSQYHVGNDVHDLAVGDFNNDGNQDLIVADGDYGIVVLNGSPAGTFEVADVEGLDLGGYESVHTLAVGDFNQDGLADIVYGGDYSVQWTTTDGSGNFLLPEQLNDTSGNQHLTVTDMNADGIADIVWVGSNAVNVLIGTGNADFNSLSPYYPAEVIGGLAVADFNGDHLPEIVVGTDDEKVVVIFHADDFPNANLVPVAVAPGREPHSRPIYVATGDFNGDGHQDILTADNFGDPFFIIRSNGGDGSSAFDAPVQMASTFLLPAGLTIGSFSGGSGRADLAAPNSTVDDIAVMLAQLPSITVTCTGSNTPIVLNVPYSSTCSGNNGIAPYTFDISGVMPTNLTFNTVTGVLSGTPTETGSFTYTITATDSDTPPQNGGTAFIQNVATLLKLSSGLPNGLRNSAYSQPLVTGGTPSYSCNLTAGSFPNGISMEGCILSGFPPTPGTSTFTISVSDSGSPAQTASQAYSLTIDPSATTTTLTSDINPSSFGQKITLRAHVNGASNATAEIRDGMTTIGTTTNSDGILFFQTSVLAAGTHSLTAYFPGDAFAAPSTSEVLSQVVLPQSATTLTVSPASPLFGQTVSLTATVTGGIANGKVVFYDGVTPVGTASLSGGQATLSTVMLGIGPRSLTADYLGSGTLSPSISAPVSKTVGVRPGATLSAATSYTAGQNVRHVAIGDFNGDGKQDLAVANYDGISAHAIGILLGNGNGIFQAAVQYDTLSDPHGFAVADFNGDGVQDLVVATPGTNSVTILNGVGDGTFGSATQFSAFSPDSIAVGDINGDGKPDVVYGNSNNVRWMPGIGDGTLDSNSDALIGFTGGPTVVTLDDFNSDGITDIAYGTSNSGIGVIPGTGGGNFGEPFTQSGGPAFISITTADVNSDGHPDIIFGASGGGVHVLLGSASGAPGTRIPYPAGLSPYYAVTGDFDGDGKLDIAVGDANLSETNTFQTLKGNGDGTFNAPVSHPVPNPPYALAVGNFLGGTGRSDLLLGSANGNVISVVLSQAPALHITCTSASAPPVLTGIPFTINCPATNGIGPLSYTQPTGTLPTGLTLDSLTGAISGTPTTAGSFSFTIHVVDSDNPQGTDTASVTVVVVTPLIAAASPLAGGLIGSSYSTTLNSGGTTPYTCGLSAGSYPPGLTVAGSTCVLSGTPTTAGDFSFTVGNSDSGSPQQNKTQAFSMTVLQSTTTSLSPGSNPAVFGQSLTLTATVAPAGATGSVTFKDGATTLGTGTVNGSGVATFSTSSLALGSHSLTAVYPGDSLNAASTSSVLTETVKNTTTTVLTSSANPAAESASITFTATVSPSSATGSVNFTADGINIGSGTLTSGVATVSNSSLTPGLHPIIATYAGDSNNLTSTSASVPQVVRTTTTTSLSVSPPTTAGIGVSVILTATVSPASAGQVTFYNGDTVLGTAPLASGTAALSTILLPAGPNKLTAYYLGNANAFPSTSSGVSETITTAPQNGFSTGVTYAAGTGPVGSATADFNGDGKADFVVANYGESTLSVFLGTGVGTVGAVTPLTVGTNPFSVTVGDFNGDGKTDIASANLSSNSVSVLLGNGDGTFAAQASYSAGIGQHPGQILASDFNGDGFADLATVNYEGNNVSILLGVGDGTFGTGSLFAVGGHPAAMAAGDFNGDGKIDLATANQTANDVSVLLGNGNGTFAVAVSYPTGGGGLQALVAHDFDGDGKLDLVTANYNSNKVSVLLGIAGGTFGSPTTFSTGIGPYALATGDFDGDGKADLVVAQDTDNNVGVLIGNGAGAFTSGGSFSTGIAGGARGITVADLNRDGISDVVVSDYSANKVSVLLGLVRTTTTLTSSVNPSTYGGATTLTATVSPSSAAGIISFYDGATFLDDRGLSSGTATFNFSALGAGIHSLTAKYSGDIFNAASTSAAISQTVSQVTTTTNLTAAPDPSTPGQQVTLTATTVANSGNTIPTGSVIFKDGSTALAGAVSLDSSGHAVLNTAALTPGVHSLTAEYSGDANDVAGTSPVATVTVQYATTLSLTTSKTPAAVGVAVTFTATVSPSSATGTITFKDGEITIGTGTLSSGVATFQTVDLAAGKHNISASYGGDTADAGSVAEPITQDIQNPTTTSLSVSPSGTSQFGTSVSLTATVSPSSAHGLVAFFDGPTFLGSRQLDEGITSFSTRFLGAASRSLTARYVGDPLHLPSTSTAVTQTITSVSGAGFGAPGTYTAGNSPSMLAQGDFNDDGIADFAVVDGADTAEHGTIEIFFGSGSGTFSAGTPITVIPGQNLDWITAVDLDNDGRTDLLAAGRAPGKLFAFRNTGEGFSETSSYSSATAPFQTAIAVGDFNGDGFVDAAVSGDGGDVAIMISNGTGGFTFGGIIPAGSNPYGVTAGDFNGDGKMDLAFANFGNDNVSVILGAGDGTFGSPATFAVPAASGPFAIQTDDLNNDGKLDLAVTNLGGAGSGVSILLGAGDGTFSSGVAYATSLSKPSSLAFGDFNGDGKRDIAVASFAASANSVSILTGDGAGVFSSPTTYAAGAWPLGLIVGDFNGDGRPDIATANGNATTNNVSVLLSLTPTTTSLTSNLNPSAFGASITLTANVSPSNSTGIVTFQDGATTLGTGTLSSGSATFNIANLSVATHSITAVYSADASHAPSTSSVLSQVVNQAPTTTTLTSSGNPSTFGAPVTLTATISFSGASGTVTFKEGAATLGTGTISGGVATFTTSAFSVGPHSLTALYGGDANYLGSTSSALTQTVNQAPTTTSLTSSVNPSTFGGHVILTATVSPLSATGTVTFKDGVTTLSTASLSGGIATLDIATLSVAAHSLTAEYGGDTNDLGSTSSALTQTVNKAPTTTSLTSSLNPSTYGASVTFTATVSPASAGGTITFKDGATTIGTGTISGGTATLDISTLSVAAHSLTADYGGDANDLASTSPALTQTVNKAPTTTTLTSSLNPSTFGTSVTLTAAVSPSSATGTITFKDGATTIGTGTLSGGSATLDISILSVAAHSLTADYGGDNNDAISTSSALTQTVNKAVTTTTLTSSLNPSTFGASVTLTATISRSTATGTVTFKDGAATIGTGTVSGGVATLDITTLSVGPHSLSADYGGDTNDAASTSSVLTQTVNLAVSATVLTSSLNPSTFGASVTLTATVTPSAATGSVTFKEGSTVLGTGTLTSGVATFPISTLSVGTHSLTADYGGDANDATSTSSALSQVVNQSPTTTLLDPSKNGNSIAGQSVTFTAHVLAQGATGTVALKEGSTTLATAPLSGGDAEFDIASLSTGAHTLTAVYGGDTNYAASTSGPVTHTVFAVTSLSLSTDSDGFSDLSQPVVITATVNPSTATGKVTFYNGTLLLGTSDIQQNGQATLTTKFLPTVDNLLTAYYPGDSTNAVSRSDIFHHYVASARGNGFRPSSDYSAASQPSSQVSGDFNGDGIADLAVANFSSNNVSILFGNGDGTFQSPANYDTGTGPASVAAGDLNGDGSSDLVVANSTGNTISLLYNTGEGTFLPQSSLPSGVGPVFVAIGDFNSDGLADIVSANSGDNTVSFLLGGGAFFLTPPPVGVGINPRAIALGDFNQDGFTDLAVTSGGTDSQLTLLFGNAAATFEASPGPAVGNNTTAITATDLTNDGHVDLIAVNTSDGTLSVLVGNGDGTFQPQNTITAGGSPTSVAVTDFDGDGITDLAVSRSTGPLKILLGNNNGTFQTPVDYTEGTAGISAVAGDFNSDGLADIAVANNGSANVTVFLGLAQTQVILTSSANPSTAGQPITLSAWVSGRNPTGTITFLDGSTVIGTKPAGEAAASLTISSLGVGSHSLTASYAGDIANAPSTSAPLTQTVNQFGTITTLTSSPSPSTFGTTVVLTATVNSPTATGTVTFKDGGANIGTAPLAGGAAIFSISTLSVGSHSLTAVYGGDVNNVGSGSLVRTQIVNRAGTVTTLTSSQNPSAFGASVTLTATIAPSSATGSVTFLDGATTLATGTLSGGVATLSISTLSVSAHSITAIYGGDTNNAGSTSSVFTQTVNQAPTTTSLTTSLNPSTFGTSLTLTATIAPSSATGIITFKDGATTLGTGTLSAGTATFSISNLPVGVHSLTTVYVGDTNHLGSTSSALTQTVNKAPTTTSLTTSLNPSTFGTSVTLTATVTPSSATGTVTFKDGGATLGTGTLSGGVATFDISNLPVAAHSLTADYGGDTNDAGSSSSVLTQTVNRAPTTTTLTSSLNPSTFSTVVTLTAAVTPSNATGTVTFMDGATAIGTGTVTGGEATFSTASLSVAVHTLTAIYGGDTNDTPSSSPAVTQTVNKAPTTVTLTSSLNPSTFAAPVTLTATMSSVSATGTVTFKDGAATLGSGTLIGGVATFDISTLSVGPHSLTVDFAGDTNYLASTSPVFTQTVNKAPTTTTITSSLNPSTFGAAITFTATISPSSATGTVTFIIDGETTLGSAAISGGIATFASSTISVGSHPVSANYNGDANLLSSSSSTLTQTVGKAPTTVTLTSSQNPAIAGIPITLSAVVAPPTATGLVTFKDGAATLGAASLSAGSATLSVSTLTAGSHSLTASYAGDNNNNAGLSAALTQQVSFSAPTIITSSLPPGQAGVKYGPVSMQATGGSGNFTWSGSNLPAGIVMSPQGELSGTATAAFSGSVIISVTDSSSNQGTSASLELTFTSAPLLIGGTSNLGPVAVGSTVTGSFTAQGGIAPYTWSLSGAPAGFTVNATGTVSGIPAVAGDSGFTLQVKDSTPVKPFTATLPVTVSAFGLTTTSLLPASTLTDYSLALGAAGGTPPYTFTATGLPGGLSLSAGTISGRPLAPGTSSVVLKATDSKGLSVSVTLSLLTTGPGPLKVLSSSLSDGTMGQPYSQTLSGEGGSPAYSWSLSGGVLPAGLSLNTSGTVFGTPTQPGSYSFGVQANDTAGGQAVGAISINVVPAPLTITNGSTLPSGIAAAIYPKQVLGATGGIGPYTFTLNGTLPQGLTLKDGQITGTPVTPGDFTVNLVVTDSATPPVTSTVPMSITIRPNSADLVLSAGSLSFALTAGTSEVPSPTSVNVTSSVALQTLDFTVDASSATWLSVSGGGSTPASLSVGLSNAALALTPTGSPYSGTVTLTCTSGTCAGKAQSIVVTLTVTSPPPQLSLTSSIFSFIASTGDPQSSSSALGIQNTGGGKLTVTSVTAADPWLVVTPFTGDVLPGPGVAVTVTANPGPLGAGYYTTSLTVKTSAGNASIPVTLLISAAATMVLGPDGAQFSMPVGGAPGNPNGSFLVSVSSTAGVAYSATVSPGASWLTGGGSGTATSAAPGTVNFSVNPTAAAALAEGAYYGTIRVTGTGIVNTPQDFQVVLNISPVATPVVPDPQPGGLLFLSASPGVQSPQAISVYASSKTPLAYQVSATTSNGGNWLSISSKSGAASAGSPGVLNALVDSTGMAPGVYTGSVSFASGPDIRSVNITLIVQTPLSPTPLVAAASGLKPATTAPACAGAKLVPVSTGLGGNFSAPASWPTPISIKLVDTCGSVIPRGQIVVTFSNGDPPLALSLLSASTAVYSGTWTPRRSAAQTIISAQATASGYSPSVIKVAGEVVPNAAPQLVPNGTLDIFHPQVGAGLGPGNIVQIYGTSLASQPIAAEILPLPTKVGGTQVLIGGVIAPLFYVSPTQVNAQIPFELQAGQQYQVIVNANGALTTPQPIQLSTAVPALLQFTSGLVIAQHGDGSLISDTAPATPGEFIVLYMTGLGATDIPVATGQASPADPLARVLDVPVLTLDDISVPLQFAGLTPGLVGLYQINLQVPSNLAAKTYELKVSQSGTLSNSTSLPVKAPPAK